MTTATIRYRDAERRARTGQSVILPRSDPATNVSRSWRRGREIAC